MRPHEDSKNNQIWKNHDRDGEGAARLLAARTDTPHVGEGADHVPLMIAVATGRGKSAAAASARFGVDAKMLVKHDETMLL
jgi:hypothetical protein